VAGAKTAVVVAGPQLAVDSWQLAALPAEEVGVGDGAAFFPVLERVGLDWIGWGEQ
jgi:hypothetical protein